MTEFKPGDRVRLLTGPLLIGDNVDVSDRLATVRGRSPYSGQPRMIVDVDGVPGGPFYLLLSELERVGG